MANRGDVSLFSPSFRPCMLPLFRFRPLLCSLIALLWWWWYWLSCFSLVVWLIWWFNSCFRFLWFTTTMVLFGEIIFPSSNAFAATPSRSFLFLLICIGFYGISLVGVIYLWLLAPCDFWPINSSSTRIHVFFVPLCDLCEWIFMSMWCTVNGIFCHCNVE